MSIASLLKLILIHLLVFISAEAIETEQCKRKIILNELKMIPSFSKYLNKPFLKIREVFISRNSNNTNHSTPVKEPYFESLSGSLDSTTSNSLSTAQEEILGVPRRLFPYYYAFLMDAVAIGLVMPLLPFSVIELGANAFQLSLVISSNYMAQSIGCVIMGRVSDMYGRKLVAVICLGASTLSYIFLAHAESLLGMAVARIVSGSFGGLLPVMQSAVADITAINERPKYLGRIMATFGFGFVLGPMISALLPTWTTRRKMLVASIFPFLGLLVVIFLGKETKRSTINPRKKPYSADITENNHKEYQAAASPPSTAVPWEVAFLVMNGFALMYTFATETIYAMFIKDAFGYGEQTLSRLLAINGLLIGIFQVFLIKPLISILGKHTTLAMGNLVLSMGMIGVALIRQPQIHFVVFTIHIIGYSIADTCLAALVTRYSSAQNQGSDLALNQAAQAVARVISPLVAGLLYEYSKKGVHIFPIGALPFIASSLLPAAAVTIPIYLKFTSSSKRKEKLLEMHKVDEVDHLLDQTALEANE